jgi:hypothetical protein
MEYFTKIPKGQAEAVNRKTDNTVTNRKGTNNYLHNITHETKYRATRIPLKTGGELRCSGRDISSCSTRCGTRLVTLFTNQFFQETEYQSSCPIHCVLTEKKSSILKYNILSVNFTNQNFYRVKRSQQENGAVWFKT